MNISPSTTNIFRTAPNAQASRKGAVRQAVESTAGLVGSVAGAAMYAVPAAVAGAEYAKDGYLSSYETGNSAVGNTFAQSAMFATMLGAVAGGLSKGWAGAGLGAVLGFTAGGVGGLGAVALQNVAGRDGVNNRLGKRIRADVDKAFEGKDRGPAYNIKGNTAAMVRGFRSSIGAGVSTGYEMGQQTASGVMSGLLDGVAGLSTSLTYGSEQADTRGFVKKALNLPLGLAVGAVTAAATAPVGLIAGRDVEHDGDEVKFVWGAAATLTGVAVGGLLTGSPSTALCVGAGMMAGSIALLMGENETAMKASERIRDASWAAKSGRAAESDDAIHTNMHNFVQDRVIATGASLNAGFATGYRAAGVLTDGLADLTASAAKGLVGLFPKAKEVATGVREGLN